MWEEKCPHCGAEIDSMDSISDSRAMLRDHIALNHPPKDIRTVAKENENV